MNKADAANALLEQLGKDWSLIQVGMQQARGTLYQDALRRISEAKAIYDAAK